MQQELSKDKQNLVTEFIGLAKSVAAKACKRYDIDYHSQEDVFSSAYLGLTEAAIRYEPHHGYAFSTFAYHRIQGSVLDGLRKKDMLGPQKKSRFLNDCLTNEYLKNQHSASTKAPKPKSVEEGIERIAEHIADVAVITRVCVEVDRVDLPGSDEAEDPLSRLERIEESQAVASAVKKLPDKEKKLIELTYFKNKSIKDAGKALGLSRSWASRLHSQAIKSLRKKLAFNSENTMNMLEPADTS